MDLQELLYERVLKPYGSLVYQQLPPPQPIIEQTRKFSAYYLLDFTSDTIPPTTMDPFANFQPITDVTLGKVTVTIQSNLKFCSYCKTNGHSIKACPLRPLRAKVNCRHCHTNINNHNYLSCGTVPVEAKIAALERLPSVTVQRALSTVYALKQIPQSLLLHPNFPVEKLSQPQYNRFVVVPRQRQKELDDMPLKLQSNLAPVVPTSQINTPVPTNIARSSKNSDQAEHWEIPTRSTRSTNSTARAENSSDSLQVNQYELLTQLDEDEEDLSYTEDQTNESNHDSGMDTDIDYS
ncbi:hypothetical protein B5S27_g5811 [[Candida] boidinii]|nr:hypothetical protein B5S27_g5811 [[Candida] boidinii]